MTKRNERDEWNRGHRRRERLTDADIPQWLKDKLKAHFARSLKAKLTAFHESVIERIVGADRAEIKSILSVGYARIFREIDEERKTLDYERLWLEGPE